MGTTTTVKSVDYVSQAKDGQLGYWKYLIPVFLFFGLMGVNILMTFLLDIDQEALIQSQIESVGRNWTLVSSVLPLGIFGVLLLLYVKFGHQQSIRSLTTSRSKIDWSRVGFSFMVISVFIIAGTLIDYQLHPESYVLNFDFSKFWILLLVAVLLIPLQTSFEEYLFRAYLMQGIGSYFKSRLLALVLTSVAFGLLHIGNPEIGKIGFILLISYIGTGFLFGVMTLMDEGLELALGYHAANNLITALLVTANWTAFQTDSILLYTGDPNPNVDIFIPVFIIYPIILFIFAKKYNWKNWKEKLMGKV